MDELMMSGEAPGDNTNRDESNASTVAKGPSGSAPPLGAFSDIPARWKQYEDSGASNNNVEDDQLSQQRRGKRVPSALSGLGLTQGRVARQPYRDETAAPHKTNSSDDDSADMESVDNSSSVNSSNNMADSDNGAALNAHVAQTKKVKDLLDDDSSSNSSSSKTWSARYKLDNTHLAMSKGTLAHAPSSQSKPARPNPKVGAGFSFRSKKPYSDYDHYDADNTNLRTAWKDVELDDEYDDYRMPQRSRSHKTWQHALVQKQRRRHWLMAGVLVCFGLLAFAFIASHSSDGHNAAQESFDTVTFYVTSDVPFDNVESDKLADDLQNIPSDADFVVHLGNIQDAAVSKCSPDRYEDAAAVLKTSPVPVLVVPGSEDWLKCPDPEASLQMWMDQFVRFEEEFGDSDEDESVEEIAVLRQAERPENFAVLHKGVLFFGLHLVDGDFPDEDRWDDMQEDMLRFLFGMLNLEQGQFRGLVLFGNARPGPQQARFFQGALKAIEKVGVPVAYIHADAGSGEVEEYSPFDDHEDVLGIQVQNGGKHPPLRVNIAFGDRPFIVGDD